LNERKKVASMINPFDLKTALLAKHAQHVVLIHFPIALFISAVAFDLTAQWTKLRGLTDAAYYNLLVAAIFTFPVLATGIVAWQLQLEGQKLKGALLLHLVLACISSATIWLVWCCISVRAGGQKHCRFTDWGLKSSASTSSPSPDTWAVS
jgi:uncharacterized membrane protein